MKSTSTGSVGIVAGGHTVLLKDDDRIAQSVLGGKPFEPDTLDFFVHQCKKAALDEVFLDIGCYSGLFSILALKEGLTPIGFEPFPPNQAQIEWNMDLNKAHFELSRVALSDKTGEARFGHTDVHLTSGGSLERKSGNGLTVQTMRLDDFYPKATGRNLPPRVAIIKMDVERHEPAVIRGGRELIKRYRPVMIIEANDADMVAAVNREMKGLGYEDAAVYDVRNLVFLPR